MPFCLAKAALLRAWKIADDSSNVLAFDKKGGLIFRKDGKLTAQEIQTLIKVIRDHL
ncbi:MAG: YtfJ family protein [Candidatus Aminicenantes bacterium]|nr:YtfJ family protein [Candidatus Aminicenantes bacterium]